jgi:hypothetical protein
MRDLDALVAHMKNNPDAGGGASLAAPQPRIRKVR